MGSLEYSTESLAYLQSVLDIEAIGTRIFVRLKFMGHKGKIIIPKTATDFRRQTSEGMAVSVGRECEWVKPGMDVVLGMHAWQIMTRPIKGTRDKIEFVVINECDIIGREKGTGESLRKKSEKEAGARQFQCKPEDFESAPAGTIPAGASY
jgi:hypothetical protein